MIHISKIELIWIISALQEVIARNECVAASEDAEHAVKALCHHRAESLISVCSRLEHAYEEDHKRIAIK